MVILRGTVLMAAAQEAAIKAAAQWISGAEAVLVCAGAGMSVEEGKMVYVNPADFAKYYPFFLKWGYKTSYEAMGLREDPNVPYAAKWALWATHMEWQGFKFAPNKGYQALRDLIGARDYFVHTSNVDSCFQRAGFDESHIYTPQGDWHNYQCWKPCSRESVWPSRPMLDSLQDPSTGLPVLTPDGELPAERVPRCPKCGGPVFPNVRGGEWFLHKPYDEQQDRYLAWVKQVVESRRRLVILEIGAGYNTPTVTRWPMEALVYSINQYGAHYSPPPPSAPVAALVRINPSEPNVDSPLLHSVGITQGWSVLATLLQEQTRLASPPSAANTRECEAVVGANESAYGDDEHDVGRIVRYCGHFDFTRFIRSLRH